MIDKHERLKAFGTINNCAVTDNDIEKLSLFYKKHLPEPIDSAHLKIRFYGTLLLKDFLPHILSRYNAIKEISIDVIYDEKTESFLEWLGQKNNRRVNYVKYITGVSAAHASKYKLLMPQDSPLTGYKVNIDDLDFLQLSKDNQIINIQFKETTIPLLGKDLPPGEKRTCDLIFVPFFLHHVQNWRITLYYILLRLKEGGNLVFADIKGDIKYFDGDFSEMETFKSNTEAHNAPKLRIINALKKLDQCRAEFPKDEDFSGILWRPELKMTDYSNAHYKVVSSFEDAKKDLFNLPDLEVSWNDIWDHHIKAKLTSYYTIGINLDILEKKEIYSEIESDLESESDPKNKPATFNRKLQLYIHKNCQHVDNFMGNKEQQTSTLTDKITRITDNEFRSIAKKGLDLLLTHDSFIPGKTEFMTFLSWEDKDTYQRRFPFFYALNNYELQPEVEQRLLQFFSLKDGKHIGNPFFFLELRNKFPIYLRKGKINRDRNRGKSEIIFKVNRERVSKKRDSSIPKDCRKACIFYFVFRLNVEAKIEKLTIFLPETGFLPDNTLLSKDDDHSLLNELNNTLLGAKRIITKSISQEKIIDFEKKNRNKASEILGLFRPENFNAELYNVSISEEPHTKTLPSKKLLDHKQFHELLVDDFAKKTDKERKVFYSSLFYNLIQFGFSFLQNSESMISIFPSSFAREKGANQVKGLGGIILGEKRVDSQNNKIKQFLRNRDKVLNAASNLLLYKISLGENANRDFIEKSLKAAVAAIIARNGSHGLGSHVLPAVSHNPYQPSDSQLLFTYLQQRLDFIAQVASEFPRWSFPAWFNSDLMMRFFLQRQILSTLVNTEELRAYEFDMASDQFDWVKYEKNEEQSFKDGDIIAIKGFVKKVEDTGLILTYRHKDWQEGDGKKELICQTSNMMLKRLKDVLEDRWKERVENYQFMLIGEWSEEKGMIINCNLVEKKLAIRVRKRAFMDYAQVKKQMAEKKDKFNEDDLRTPLSMHIKDATDFGQLRAATGKPSTKKSKFYGLLFEPVKFEKEKESSNTLFFLSDNFIKHTIECRLSKKAAIPKAHRKFFRKGKRVIIEGKLIEHKQNKKSYYVLSNAKVLEFIKIEFIIGDFFHKASKNRLHKDIPIAIPGGIVGYQAFYTILENVIRNSAKHDFINLRPDEQLGRNLEINIELEEKQEKFDEPEKEDQEYVLCRVWTNAGNLFGESNRLRASSNSSKSIKCVDDYLKILKIPDDDGGINSSEANNLDKEEKQEQENKKLHHILSGYINERLITNNGDFKKHNLGLSETKIAAGFLNQQDVKVIGGYGRNHQRPQEGKKEEQDRNLIQVAPAWDIERNSIVPRLGFRFRLKKPREVIYFRLFKQGEHPTNQAGIYEKSIKDLDATQLGSEMAKDLDYDFCVIDYTELNLNIENNTFLKVISQIINSPEGNLNDNLFTENVPTNFLKEEVYFPLRLVIVLGEKISIIKAINRKLRNGELTHKLWRFIMMRIAFVEKLDLPNLNPKPLSLLNTQQKKRTKYEEFKLDLYFLWLKHLGGHYEHNFKLEINLGLHSGEYKEDQEEDNSIITGTYHTFLNFIAEEYSIIAQNKDDQKEIERLLKTAVKPEHYQNQNSFIQLWVNNIKEKKEKGKDWVIKQTDDNIYADKLSHIFSKYKNIYKKLFARNSGEVETLPPIYKPITKNKEAASTDKDDPYSLVNLRWTKLFTNKEVAYDEAGKRIISIDNKGTLILNSNNKKTQDISYVRHGKNKTESFYYEYLSGGQIFYSLLKEHPVNNYPLSRLVCQLYENALPRLMVVDERVRDYVERFDYYERLERRNLLIPHYVGIEGGDSPIPIYGKPKKETKSLEPKRIEYEWREGESKKKAVIEFLVRKENKANLQQYPHKIAALVVHHSVIEEFFNDDIDRVKKKKKNNEFIKFLKFNEAVCVIVTSGKGQPSDLSDYASFIPFSNIENFILQTHPEKFLLTQILLKTQRN